MSEKDGIYSLHIHNYLIGQIKFADDKAKATFAISAAILMFLFNKDYPDYQVLMVFPYIGEWGIKIVLFISIFMLFLSTTISLRVIHPNLSGSSRGFIFFQSISLFPTSEDYYAEFNKLSSNKVEQELVKHNYELSTVVTRKYKNLNKAFTAGVTGFVLMLGYLLLLKLVV